MTVFWRFHLLNGLGSEVDIWVEDIEDALKDEEGYVDLGRVSLRGLCQPRRARPLELLVGYGRGLLLGGGSIHLVLEPSMLAKSEFTPSFLPSPFPPG